MLELNKKVLKKLIKPSKSGTAGDVGSKFSFLDKDGKILLERDRATCYYGMPSDIMSLEKVTHIRLYVRNPRINKAWPNSDQDMVYWISKCLENKGLILSSEDTTGWDIITEGLTIPIDHPLATVDRIYIAGCLLRMANEYPVAVRTAIDLMQRCDTPFWAAFYYAHAVCAPGQFGHSFLNVGGAYSLNKHWCSLEALKELNDYFKNNTTKREKIIDAIKNAKEKKQYSAWSWDTANLVTPQAKGKILAEPIKLVFPQIRDYLNAETQEERDKIAESINETKLD